jgi:hypothetical protein
LIGLEIKEAFLLEVECPMHFAHRQSYVYPKSMQYAKKLRECLETVFEVAIQEKGLLRLRLA